MDTTGPAGRLQEPDDEHRDLRGGPLRPGGTRRSGSPSAVTCVWTSRGSTGRRRRSRRHLLRHRLGPTSRHRRGVPGTIARPWGDRNAPLRPRAAHAVSGTPEGYNANRQGRGGKAPMGGGERQAAYRRIKCWLTVVVLMAALASGVRSTWAQSIEAGSLELTLAVGGGASLPKNDLDLQTVTTFHVLPHLGYFVTGEVGEGTLRGNLEILFEPTLIHLDASPSATVVGGAILPRWLFGAWARVRPYIEAGLGIVGGQIDLRQTNCDVNFLVEGGVGAMIFMTGRVALTIGARFHHMSNADRCSENEGLNSIIGVVGISYFLR